VPAITHQDRTTASKENDY